VNIIGEHTDYSAGFVFPAAIPLYTGVAVGTGTAGELKLFSTSFGELRLSSSDFGHRGDFGDYLAGAVKEMRLEGHALNILIHADLPAGSGLSSSASLLVSTVTALAAAQGRRLPPMEAALAARRVENDHVGVPCGFMDQFAVAMGIRGQALFLDCRDHHYEAVDASLPGAEWLVVYSGLSRKLSGGGYAHKVAAVKAALEGLRGLTDGDDLLRTASPSQLRRLAAEAGLPEDALPLLQHVASENRRVLLLRYHLSRKDARSTGRVLVEGHESLSQDFGVSTPVLDRLVRHTCSLPGVLGMRLTGAGMGGSLIALVQRSHTVAVSEQLVEYLSAEVSSSGQVFVVGEPVQGVMGWTL
jgi:galactokinase